jgi:hypothetical protein
MTRTEFVQAYAQRSGLPDKFAELGFIDNGAGVMIALPCACGDGCRGWAMVSGNSVLDHLFLHAPDELRTAYRRAIEQAETVKPVQPVDRLKDAYWWGHGIGADQIMRTDIGNITVNKFSDGHATVAVDQCGITALFVSPEAALSWDGFWDEAEAKFKEINPKEGVRDVMLPARDAEIFVPGWAFRQDGVSVTAHNCAPYTCEQMPSPAILVSGRYEPHPQQADVQSSSGSTIEVVVAKPSGKPGPGDVTYYTEGRDAEYFENLDDAEFVWRITRASQDIVDNDFGPIEYWMPITAMLDSAAQRIKALSLPAAVSAIDAFEIGFRWRGSLQGQNVEDSRAVGRTLESDALGGLKVDLAGFDSFQSGDSGIVDAKKRILAALAAVSKPDLRALVDVVWQHATESAVVPSTKTADMLIDRWKAAAT